jgi:LysM repeat protein
MNSIRPLVTIAILVVVGAFLYVKINEGPARIAPPPSEAWPDQSLEGVPPLGVAAETAPSNTAAPLWPADAPVAAPSPVAAANSPVATAQQPPAVPEIPAMPNVESAEAAVPVTASAPLPVELPANIPTARYPDEVESTAGPDANAAAISPVPSVAAVPAPAEPAALSTAPGQETPSQQAESVDVAAAGLDSPPLSTQPNPLRDAPATPADDRYGTAADPAKPANPETQPAVTQASFAATWPAIQATLERGELAEAHKRLSKWHDDPTLTPTDAELVDNLLSQLAGTVVYSTEHQLEPARVVKPGETLETIAKEYDVPRQLLAKINGIAAANQVQPGQELKVVRGPFSAVVDVSRKCITLLVDDRYAGRFLITVPSVSAITEGEWVVDKKLAGSPSSVSDSAYAPAPAEADRAIVLRSATAAGGAASTVAIACGNVLATSAAAGTPVIQISPQDAEDLSGILSIGSRVVIRR